MTLWSKNSPSLILVLEKLFLLPEQSWKNYRKNLVPIRFNYVNYSIYCQGISYMINIPLKDNVHWK